MDSKEIAENPCNGEVKDEISEDMISKKFTSFIKEGKGMRHIYKITLLESRYNSWLKKFDHLHHKKRNMLMTKKKCDKNMLPAVIDSSQTHIRWIKFVSEGLMTCVKSSAVVLGSGYYLFIYDLNSSRWEFISCSKFQAVDGIGCLEGAKDEDLFAFSEKSNESRIFIITYPGLQAAYKLKDNCGGKVMALGFGGNETLIVLKCHMTEHYIVIWSWRTSKVIFNYPCDKSYLHPELFRVSNFSPSCAVLEYYQNQQVMQFWNINFCGGDTVFINRRSSVLQIDNDIHDMIFSADNVLYLLDSKGNVFDGLPCQKEYELDVVNEQNLQGDHEKRSKSCPPKLDHIDYASDDYDAADVFVSTNESTVKNQGKKCHMIWFMSGIVVSGPDGKIKYCTYSAESNNWKHVWGKIPADPCTQFVTTKGGDTLMGWSNKYGLITITPDEPPLTPLYYFGGSVKDMCFLHPLDSFIITINNEPVLYVWKKKTGRLLNFVNLECEMDTILCHYNSPLVILKSAKAGIIYGIELKDPRNPVCWPPFKLTKKPLTSLTYFHNKEILVALSYHKTNIFLLKVTIDTGIKVIATFEVRHEVLHFISVSSDDGMNRGLALLDAIPEDEDPIPSNYKAGKIFDAIRYPHAIIDKTWQSNNLYKSIITGPGLGQVLAIPADKKGEIHNFHVNFMKAGGWIFLGTIQVYHQVGTFEILIHEKHLLTYGFDGIVTCYDAEELSDPKTKPFCVIVPHHRFDGGINQVIIGYKANYVISRGCDGLLICSRIKLKNRCHHSCHIPQKYLIQVLQLKKCDETSESKYWEDIYRLKKLEKEKILAQDLLIKIRKEFLEIQKVWHTCFEENEKENSENKIPWDEFELEKTKRDQLIVSYDNEIFETLDSFEKMYQLNKAWIQRWQELCYDMMSQKLNKLKPFVARYLIENYNQSIKPKKYEAHCQLFKMICDLNTAVFPIPDPKMLPWFQLNENEEYHEFKLQKSMKDDSPASKAVDKMPVKSSVKNESEIMQEDTTVKQSTEDIPVEDFKEVIAYQDNVKQELRAGKRKEKEKMIFQELEKIRLFYNEKLLKIKYTEEGQGKTFEEWKKLYIYGKADDDSSDKIETVNILEKSVFEDEKEVLEKSSEDDVGDKEAHAEEAEEMEEEEVETIIQDGDRNTEDPAERKSEDGQGEQPSGVNEDQEGTGNAHLDEVFSGEAVSASNDKENVPDTIADTEDSSSFSWSEIDIGIQKPREHTEVDKKEKHVKPPLTRKGTVVLEFGDLTKKIELVTVGSVDPLEEPFCMNGAQSARLIEVDYGSCNEFSLNGLFMTNIQISTLQSVIEDLENDFNKRFKTAFERKYKDMARIKKNTSILMKHIDDLVTVCKGSAPTEVPENYEWTKTELLPFTLWEKENVVKTSPVGPRGGLSETKVVESIKTEDFVEINDGLLVGTVANEKDISMTKVTEESQGDSTHRDERTSGIQPNEHDKLPVGGEERKDILPEDISLQGTRVDTSLNIQSEGVEGTAVEMEINENNDSIEKMAEQSSGAVEVVENNVEDGELHKDGDGVEGKKHEGVIENMKAMSSTELPFDEGVEEEGSLSMDINEESENEENSEQTNIEFLKDQQMLEESLEKMMGGAFQLTWQEKLREEIPIPQFMIEKTPDDFTPEDMKLLQKYLFEKAVREKQIQFHQKTAENEIRKLIDYIKEIVYKHDIDLLDLMKRRLVTEGSIQSELLKIARIKQKRLIADNTLQNIKYMKELLVSFQDEGLRLSAMSKVFLKKTALLYNEIDKHQTTLKNIEADFFNKVEPLKLTKKNLEILRNCMKKKPTMDIENKIYPTELLSIARSLLKHKSLPYFSAASKSFFKSLSDLDSIKNCPSNVDPDVWNILVDHRHQKIVSDIKCKALQMLVIEAEKTASLYYKYFVGHLKRYDLIKCHIRDQKINLEHHCRKIEFQLLLPEGLVESHQTGNIEDFRDCVYVSRRYIDDLNKEIVELQKLKGVKWKDFDKYMEVVHNAELLHKELQLKIRIKDNLLRDIRTAKINKYTKDFLTEYEKKYKLVYDVQLLDHRKQERIKTMVKKYFQTYYKSIKNIKEAKTLRSEWIKDNLDLVSKNSKLAAENQELLSAIEEFNTFNKDDEKLLDERNKAILLRSKLLRKYDGNIKRIDELEAELHKLYLKNYPTFSGN